MTSVTTLVHKLGRIALTVILQGFMGIWLLFCIMAGLLSTIIGLAAYFAISIILFYEVYKFIQFAVRWK